MEIALLCGYLLWGHPRNRNHKLSWGNGFSAVLATAKPPA
jgi:hypothetical protein